MRSLSIAALSMVAASVHAQIVLKPSGEDAVKLLPKTVDVRSRISGGVADTVWTYTFANANRFEGQADFLIKIPKGGVVHGFAYWYQGEKVIARVAEKERAKKIYENIVNQQRDPALVELVGKDTFRVRVFPIDPSADLRVELKIAQSLPATPKGATLSIPLKQLGKLERATVSVSGDHKLMGSWGPVGSSVTYSLHNSVASDLKVTEGWSPQTLHHSIRAARSGGVGGFFVLNLTPSRPVKKARWKLSGEVYDVVETRNSAGQITLVGRYRKLSTLTVLVTGEGYRAQKSITLSEQIEANGPATKLWAWAKIGRSKSRKEIVALSSRFTVPSKYTSWIAMPEEERVNLRRREAEDAMDAYLLKNFVRLSKEFDGNVMSRRATLEIANIARRLGVSRSHWSPSDLAWRVYHDAAEAWSNAAVELGLNSSAARKARSTAERASIYFDSQGYEFQLSPTSLAPMFASRVVRDRIDRDQSLSARRRARELSLLAKQTSRGPTGQTLTDLLEQAAYEEVTIPSVVLARQERVGKVDPKLRLQLRRNEQRIGLPRGKALRAARVEEAKLAMGSYENIMQEAIESNRPWDDFNKVAVDIRREVGVIRRNGGQPRIPYPLESQARNRIEEFINGSHPITVWRETRKRLDAFAVRAGYGSGFDWHDTMQGQVYGLVSRIGQLELDARRNHKELEASRQRLKVLQAEAGRPFEIKPFVRYDSNWSFMPNMEARDRAVKALHGNLSDQRPLDELYRRDLAGKGKAYADLRRSRLLAETELDHLDRQKPDPDVLARINELEAKASELRARMGDPIVSVDDPDAKQVLAKMPDGTWLTMNRVPGTGRWEGRFDVPPGAADGRYEIQVFVDGVPVSKTAIHVDTEAPVANVSWFGPRAEVRTAPDVKRVAGFTPDGERIELTREAPGVFAARAPAGTTFVATDAAHNRSDVRPEVPKGTAPWTDPNLVTTLANVDGRLWIGTANEGGGFADVEHDLTRPWVKSAVVASGALAVRYAHGEVVWGNRLLKLPRHSTSIAAGRDGLLVGTIGGYFRVKGDQVESIFPTEVAGVVVTCLLEDSERVWLGTQGRGIAEIRNGRFVRWHDERSGLGDDWVTALGVDAGGDVIGGTFVGGAFRLSDSKWSRVEGTQGTSVTAIEGDWMATRQGVFHRGVRISDSEATALKIVGTDVWLGTRTGVQKLERQ